MARTIFYTEEALVERIREVRDSKELLEERELYLVQLYNAVHGKKDAIIDETGRLLSRKTTKITIYKQTKPIEHSYRRILGLGDNSPFAPKRGMI